MGVTTIRASCNYIMIRRENKEKRFWREYFIITWGVTSMLWKEIQKNIEMIF